MLHIHAAIEGQPAAEVPGNRVRVHLGGRGLKDQERIDAHVDEVRQNAPDVAARVEEDVQAMAARERHLL